MKLSFSLSAFQKTNILAASFGSSSLVVQTEFLRGVMQAAAGGTLAVGAALGAWLCWIAIGALLGGWLASSSLDTRKSVFLVCALALPSAIFPIILLSGLRLFMSVPYGQMIPLETLALWSALACCPFGLVVGLSFPLFAKMASRNQIAYPSVSGVFLGGLWGAEAFGAFLSGIVFTFLLAGRTNPLANTAVFGSLPVLVCSSLSIYPGKPGRLFSASFIFICLVIFIRLPFLERQVSFLYWRGFGSPGELLSLHWTRYSTILFDRVSDQTTLYDNGQPVLNFPDPYTDASQVAILLGQCPEISRVLVVGPAAGGIAQALFSAGVSEVTSVYPDREAEKELLGYLPEELRRSLSMGNYRYISDDARAYLGRPPAHDDARARPAGWDVVLLNLDGPTHMNSSRYYTPGFFQRARRAFGPAGGVLALRIPIGANVLLPAELDQAASVWASLRKTFRHLALGLNSTHCYIFATDRDSLLTQNLDTLMARVQPFEGKVPNLTRYILPMYFDSTRTVPLAKALEKRSRALGPHTDSTPVAWLHSLRLWARLARQAQGEKSGPGLLEKLFDWAANGTSRGIAFWPALILTICFLLIWFAASKGKTAAAVRWAAVLTTAASGFSAMGATVSLIYVCQLVFGDLFYQVAMITAVFMLSMAAGSFWGAKRAEAGPSGGAAVAYLAFLVSLAVSLPPVIIYLLDPLYGSWGSLGTVLAAGLFYLTVVLAGLFCGALFPWSAALHGWALAITRTDRTAAQLDFADHLGATAGALTVGVFAVPALGLSVVGSSLALCMICVALFWFFFSQKIL